MIIEYTLERRRNFLICNIQKFFWVPESKGRDERVWLQLMHSTIEPKTLSEWDKWGNIVVDLVCILKK